LSEPTSTSEQDFKKAQADLAESERRKTQGPPNPQALEFQDKLVKDILVLLERFSYPAVLTQASETARALDLTLTSELKHLAENNGLLQSLLNALEHLQKTLDAEAKAQAEQRALEKETLQNINKYLALWQ